MILNMFSELRLLLIANIAMALLSYTCNVVLANAMGPDDYGIYTYLLVIGTVLAEFIVFGLSEIGTRWHTAHPQEANTWITSAKFFNFFILFFGLVFYVFLYSHNLTTLLAAIVAITGLSYSTVYENKKNNKRYAIIYLTERFLHTIIVILGVAVIGSNYLLLVFLSLFTIQTLSIAFQYKENKEIPIIFSPKSFSKIYLEGFFVVVFNLSKYVYGGGIRMIIFHQLGSSTLGIFSVAWQFIALVTLFTSQVVKASRLQLTLSIKSRNKKNFIKQCIFFTLVSTLPMLVLFVIFYQFGGLIIRQMFVEEYWGAISFMPYIGAYAIILGIDSCISAFAFALSISRITCLTYSFFSVTALVISLWGFNNPTLYHYFWIILTNHLLSVAVIFIIVLFKLKSLFSTSNTQ